MLFLNKKLSFSRVHNNCCSVCIVLVMMLSMLTQASESDLVNETQCYDTSSTYKRALLSQTKKNKKIAFNDSFYVSKVPDDAVLIDVRVEDLTKNKAIVRPKKALHIPLNLIKAKTYLKDKPVVLMGHGWDDYRLGYELDNLRQRGFKSVKILKHGVLSIIHDYSAFPYLESTFSHHIVPVKEIFSTALLENNKDSFLFINSGKLNPIYERFGLQFVDIHNSNNELFYAALKKQIEHFSQGNKELQVVIVHQDPNYYEQIYNKVKSIKDVKFWFAEGGYAAVFALNKKVAATVVALNRVEVLCSS